MARPAFKTASASFPSQGNRELPIVLNFSASVISIVDDLSPEMQESKIESIQNVYIDNSSNPSSFTIQFNQSGQRITVTPFTQGVYPVINWARLSYTAQTVGAVPVTLIFSNTAKDFTVFGPSYITGPGQNLTPFAGSAEYGLALNPAQKLLPPAGATVAIIQAETATVYYTLDGTTPSATNNSYQLSALSQLTLNGAAMIAAAQFFSATGLITVTYAR